MNSNFKKIKLDMLAKYQISPVDIYINLGSKFVKIIASDSKVVMAELKHYIDKDIEYVWVSEENFKILLDEISSKVQTTKKEILAQKIEMTSLTFHYIKSKLENLNITEADIEMINSATQSFISELNSSGGSLKSKLTIFFAREDYLLNHSLMTLFLTTHLVQKLGWNSDQTYSKINYASLFSDIILDNPYLAKIRRLNEENYLGLTKEQKELVTGHQNKSIEMLANAGVVQHDIDSLILSHQELPDGTGYNRGLFADKISPLSCAFNIVYYFCQDFLNKDLNVMETKDILGQMEELFNKGNYKQPYKAFSELISE